PEARSCPLWCCTQNSHALRITPMSSLGRFLPIVASNSANFAARTPGSAGGSSGVECTVAIPDYRLMALRLLPAWRWEPLSELGSATRSLALYQGMTSVVPSPGQNG